MRRKWLKIIAVLEIVGGNVGILWVLWQISSAPLSVLGLLLALFVFGVYLLSILAGVALWKGRPFGRTGSIIVQITQLPKIISPWLVFMISIGVDVYPHILFSVEAIKVGIEFRSFGAHQVFLNVGDAPLGFGVSITSLFFLSILRGERSKIEAAAVVNQGGEALAVKGNDASGDAT